MRALAPVFRYFEWGPFFNFTFYYEIFLIIFEIRVFTYEAILVKLCFECSFYQFGLLKTKEIYISFLEFLIKDSFFHFEFLKSWKSFLV